MIDGATYLPSDATPGESINGSGYSVGMGSFGPVMSPALTAGSRTIKVQLRNSTQTSTALADTELYVLQFRGGYTHPENVPILQYDTAANIDVVAGPGADSEAAVNLNDGKRYRAGLPLEVDLTGSGLGGLDTGSEAASTWYYVYAVPDTAVAGTFDVLCSVTDPDSGGPTGYDVWRYLGCFYNDSSTNIRNFEQIGDHFHYTDYDETELRFYYQASAPTTGSWLQITQTDIDKAFPVDVAGEVFIGGLGYVDAGESFNLYFAPGNPPPYTPSSFRSIFLSCTTGADSQTSRDTNTRWFPNTDGTFSVYYPSASGSIIAALVAHGYRDKYLSTNMAQAVIPVRDYGEAYVSSSSATTVPDGTWATLAGTFADGELQDFTRTLGVLKYVGTRTKKFKVDAALSVSASVANTVLFRLSKNGTTIAASQQQRYLSASNDMGAVSLTKIIELAYNDTVEIEVSRSGGAATNVTAEECVFNVTEA